MSSYALLFLLVLLFANSGSSPLSTSTSTPNDFIDRVSLPPYNPNNSPRSAEELLETLVNPVDFDLGDLEENYPESDPFLTYIVQEMSQP